MSNFAALTVVFVVGLTGVTNGQLNAPENCKMLSECLKEGEKYFNQYDSLRNERDNLNPQPKTEVEKCNAELNEMKKQLDRLNSKKRLDFADCVLNNTVNATIAASQKNKTEALFVAFKNNSVNRPGQISPQESVKLTTCKCEQSEQLKNHTTIYKSKRSACDAFNPACPPYSAICGKKLNNANSTQNLAITYLNQNITIKSQVCTNLTKNQ